MKIILKKLFPPSSRRRTALVKFLAIFGVSYFKFNPVHNFAVEKSSEIQRILPNGLVLNEKPLISIVVPVYNVHREYFDALLNSVLNQSYENFELIIPDGSNDKKTIKFMNEIPKYDSRIKRIAISNKGISENTNAGIKIASGEYIALLDHDDLLHPDALLYMVATINARPEADFIYSDECKLTENGEFFIAPHFKPDFSPELLNNLNYITHFSVIRKSIFKSVGLFEKNKDGAQDYDMFLRISDHTRNIVHVPLILYHWREAISSTASNFDNKKSVADAGITALEQHFERNNIKAKVNIRHKTPGFYNAAIEASDKKVAIVINTKDSVFTESFVKKLISSTASDHKLGWYVIGSQATDDDKSIQYGSFSQSIQNILSSNFDSVVYIDTLALPKDERWLDTLVAFLSQKHIGILTPTIVDYLRIVLYKGEVTTPNGLFPIFSGRKHNEKTSFGDADWDRDVDRISTGIICFNPTILSDAVPATSAEMISSLNKICDEKSLYKASLGRCLFETVFEELNSFGQTLNSSGYFNQNLSQYGSEDFEQILTGQIPVTNHYNLMSELE